MLLDAEMDDSPYDAPAELTGILESTASAGFGMASEPRTGSLLAVLAATKPAAHVLELGTGTGVGTAWLLKGMDSRSQLISVEADEQVLEIALRHLGHDPRVSFVHGDGDDFLDLPRSERFDLIFADTWPGKFRKLDRALALLRPGGIYVIDDLLPQPSWPEDHAPKVPRLIADIEEKQEFRSVKLSWASGLMLVVRRT
jgi:predicted O-methyltransferase YrrM